MTMQLSNQNMNFTSMSMIYKPNLLYIISQGLSSHTFFRNLRTLVGACARNPSVFSLEKNGLFSTYILLEKLLFATDLSEVNFLDRDHQIYLH